MPPQQCCKHKLTACDDEEDVIYTKSAGLSKKVGKVVTLSTPDDPTCRTVERICSLPEGEEWTAVVVDEVFDDCEACGPPCACFKLENCVIPGQIIYTETDLSDYVGGSVVLDEYPSVCWAVTCGDETCTDPEPVTVVESFPTCADCIDDEVPDTGNTEVECQCLPNTQPVNYLVRLGTMTGCCSPLSNNAYVVPITGTLCLYRLNVQESSGCFFAHEISVRIGGNILCDILVDPSCSPTWASTGFPSIVFPDPHSCKHTFQNYQIPFRSADPDCSCASPDPMTIWAV